MLDTPKFENLQDFRQRYLNTFGWLHLQENKKILVKVTDVQDDKVMLKDINNRELYAYADKGVMFEFLPCQRGWYPTEDNLYYLTRIPARMWQRGIARANTTMFECIEGRGLRNVGFTEKILIEIFKTSATFESEIQLFNKSYCDGAAFSREFAVFENLLYFFNEPVGRFNKITKEFVVNSFVLQEFSDLIRRSNINAGVISE